MIDEFTKFRYIKKIMKHGVPKDIASEIVDASKDCSNIDYAISYSLQIIYGLNFKSVNKRG